MDEAIQKAWNSPCLCISNFRTFNPPTANSSEHMTFTMKMARFFLWAISSSYALASPLRIGSPSQQAQAIDKRSHYSRSMNNTCSSLAEADPGFGVEHYEVGGVRNATSWPYKIYKSVPFNPPVWEVNATGEDRKSVV